MDRKTLTALLVAGVFFMENLDATVITTAVPFMAKDFRVEPTYLSLGISAYMVALTVFIPISGWAADRFGARRLFPSAIAVFTLASLFCALSTTLTAFTAARTLQGIGGAMMVPVGRLVVLRDTPKHQIVSAIAILTWPALVAPVLGPVFGGWLSVHLSWHWIFLINIPLGLAAFAASCLLVKDGPKDAGRFDTVGFVISGLGFALFMGGIEMAGRSDIPLFLSGVTIAASMFFLAATLLHMRQTPHPLFGLAPLRIRTFRITVTGGTFFRTAVGSAPFMLPLMFQLSFGWSAVEAGAMLLWLFAGNLAMKPATTAVMRRFGFKRVLLVNGVLVALGFAACSLLSADTPKWLIAALMFVSGMCRSMQFTALNTIGFADVPAKDMRDATTLFSVLQQMNAGMGISFGALAIAVASSAAAHNFLIGTSAIYPTAFLLMAFVALTAVADIVTLPRDAGSAVLKKDRKTGR